jgi:hypothetical protein
MSHLQRQKRGSRNIWSLQKNCGPSLRVWNDKSKACSSTGIIRDVSEIPRCPESRDAIQAEVEREKQLLSPDSGDTKYPVIIALPLEAFDCVTLFFCYLQFRLRSVLVHDGQYTSRSVYSYVRAPNGKWWKILLDEAVEVSLTGFPPFAAPHCLAGIARSRAQ